MNEHGVKVDTFLVSDPIKPYHVINNTLSYAEEDRRRKIMDMNTQMNCELKMNNAELKYLLEDTETVIEVNKEVTDADSH